MLEKLIEGIIVENEEKMNFFKKKGLHDERYIVIY